METINIEVNTGVYTEITNFGEDKDLIFAGPLAYFKVIHSGWGIIDKPEQILVQAFDVFNNLKVNYVGTISLFTVGETGEIVWSSTGAGIFNDGGNGRDWATYKFDLSDGGQAVFYITDNIAETVDVDVRDRATQYDDDDFYDPLRFAAFDHFTIYHYEFGVIGFNNRVIIQAEDTANNPVYGITGNITISFDTGVTGEPSGLIAFTLGGGRGTLTEIETNLWVYNMAVTDGGIVTLFISDTMADTLDIEATDGIHVDDDTLAPFQYLKFGNFNYHYVAKNNPTPMSPYITPDAAATNI